MEAGGKSGGLIHRLKGKSLGFLWTKFLVGFFFSAFLGLLREVGRDYDGARGRAREHFNVFPILHTNQELIMCKVAGQKR